MAEEAIAPKRQIKWGQLVQGVSVCALALTCAGADIYNNAVFALEKSAVIAIAFVVAGAGLVLLPTMAKGRDIIIAFLVLVCGGLSLFAGYQNHMTSQRNHDLAERAITERYDGAQIAIKAAQDDYNKAKTDAEEIKEPLGSAELKVAYDAASKLYEDNKAACGPVCKAARDEIKVLPDRIGKAKAKEDAKKRMDDALARWNSEKASAPKQAKAAGASAAEENIMAVLLLLLTIGGATLTHRGHHLIMTAFVIFPLAKIKRDPAAKPVVKHADPAPGEQKRHDIAAFIRDCLEPAGEDDELASPSVLHDNLSAYWAIYNSGRGVPNKVMLGRALGKKGANFPKRKVNGDQCYAVKVRDWKSEAKRAIAVKVA